MLRTTRYINDFDERDGAPVTDRGHLSLLIVGASGRLWPSPVSAYGRHDSAVRTENVRPNHRPIGNC